MNKRRMMDMIKDDVSPLHVGLPFKMLNGVKIMLKFFFFTKGNISILRTYQFYPVFAITKCPKDIKDAHSSRKKEKK